MRFPTSSDSVQTLINLGRYASSRVRADPEVKSLAYLIADAQATLVKAIGARNGAADLLIDREAVRDHAVLQLNNVVMDLGRQAYAQFGSRSDKGYLRLFPQAPSAIALVPDRERQSVLTGFIKEWKSAQTPKAFAPTVKKLLEAWAAVEAADTGVAAHDAQLMAEREAEGAAREGWYAGYRRLHAQLTDKFPQDKGRVESYFRSAAVKAKAKKPALVTGASMPVRS
jgi:hypothetical protein